MNIFAQASTTTERRDALQPAMLTTPYDMWLAEYLFQLWIAGSVELAEYLQTRRFMLRLCLETSVDEGLQELDDALPPQWAKVLDGSTADPSLPELTQARRLLDTVVPMLASPAAAALTPFQLSLIETKVGDWLSAVGLASDGTDELDQALAHYEEAIKASPRLDCLWSVIFGKAAMVVNQRYRRTQSLLDVDLTLSNAEAAISAALVKQLELGDFHGIWAAGLRNTAELVQDSLYWQAASSAFSQAAALTRPDDQRRQFYVESAGASGMNAERAPVQPRLPTGLSGSSTVETERMLRANPELRDRIVTVPKNTIELSDDEFPHDLDATIAAAEKRQASEVPGTRGYWAQGLMVAQLLLDRYGIAHAEADLDVAAEHAAAALAHLNDDAVLTAYSVQAALALARGAPGRDVATTLAPGMRWAAANPSPSGLQLSTECADTAADAGAWPLAAEAYSTALHIHTALVQRQVGRGYQEHMLARGPALGALAAFAHTRSAAGERAVEDVDLSRAQLMSNALRRDDADLTPVRARGRSDLADAFLAAVGELDDADRTEQPDVSRAAAQKHLEAAVTAIRAVPGLDGFLLPLDSSALREVAQQTRATIVYLLATRYGGAIVAVSASIVQARIVAGLADVDARAYAAAMTAKPGTAAHSRAVDAACGWLGAQLEPELAALELDDRIIVVPCGPLSSFPVHAAWVADGTRRRYVFDNDDVGYTPNAQALQAAHEILASAGRRVEAAAIFEQPPGPGARLASAPFEAQLAAACYRGLGADVATPLAASADAASVLAAFERTDAVHLACHADADVDEPLHSGIALAADSRLTVADIMRTETRARLVVISACESGVAGRALPDEVVSLPSALIEAGCASVIASMWRVADNPTALFMLEFYRRVSSGTQPSAALAAARRWLREATNEQLLEAVEASTARDNATDLRRQLSLDEPDEQPFAAVAHWAAFVHVGA